ncbi:hypothetical protein EIP86_010761 [Pleurotus ostreatoroseus]|nr:hypothetical protein EIP86_010761 [Pleurotus ostreatoroseus]
MAAHYLERRGRRRYTAAALQWSHGRLEVLAAVALQEADRVDPPQLLHHTTGADCDGSQGGGRRPTHGIAELLAPVPELPQVVTTAAPMEFSLAIPLSNALLFPTALAVDAAILTFSLAVISPWVLLSLLVVWLVSATVAPPPFALYDFQQPYSQCYIAAVDTVDE